MKVIIFTDEWWPQINGVVTTLSQVKLEGGKLGHDIIIVNPLYFQALPSPYSEIKASLVTWRRIRKIISGESPNSIHIATEGPIGWAARNACLKMNIPFTSSYHTDWPKYMKMHFRIPEKFTQKVMHRFHKPSSNILVTTESMRKRLANQGFENLQVWNRGVDFELFNPIKRTRPKYKSGDTPHLITVSRISREKNIEAFLNLNLEAKKIVVGDGPDLERLKNKYSDVTFTGMLRGEKLANAYANADCFVFPSKTDTYGVVMLEALASNIPVAAYPVTGPIDVITNRMNGYLDYDLEMAIWSALQIDNVRNTILNINTWRSVTEQFIDQLHSI